MYVYLQDRGRRDGGGDSLSTPLKNGRGLRQGPDAIADTQEWLQQRAQPVPPLLWWSTAVAPGPVALLEPNQVFSLVACAPVLGPLTATSARIYVDTNDAGSNVATALYALQFGPAANLTLVPGSVVTFSGATAGAVTKVLESPVTLVPGLQYFAAHRSSSGVLRLTSVNGLQSNRRVHAPAWLATAAFPPSLTIDATTVSNWQGCPIVSYFSDIGSHLA